MPTEQVELEAGEVSPTAREVEALRDRVQELRAEVERLQRQVDERANEAEVLRGQLSEITGGTGWKLLQVLYRVRHTAFPRGSRREAAARWVVHKLRRVRYHSRQGVGALLQAGGRAVLRPLRWRGTRPDDWLAAVKRGGKRQRTRIRPGEDPNVETPGLVSVVLPVYNQANLLGDAIESVLKQTYGEFELIVLDDGSTDDVATVLARYVDDPRVRVLRQRNQRLPKALSNGFEFASGQYRCWTSADNLMEPSQLSLEVDYLRRHPQTAMVYGNYLAIDDRGAPLHDPSFRPHNRPVADSPAIHLPHDPTPLNTVEDNFIGPAFVYRDWAGCLAGEYTPTMGLEDYDYWMRMNSLVEIAHLDTDECVYQYRVHDNTLSARAVELRILEGVQRLMACDRRRREALVQPAVIYADERTRRWLAKVDTTGDEIRRLERMEAAEGERPLVLVHADSLAALAERPRPAGACVAAWFDERTLSPYLCRRELRGLVDVCFAGQIEVVERLKLLHRAVFRSPPGQTLFDLAVAFARSRGSYEETVPAEQRRRQLPEPFDVPGSRRRVLLQAEHFVQGGYEQVVLDVAKTLREEGFEPRLLVLGRRGHAVQQARALGLEILSLPETGREAAYRRLLSNERIELVNAHFTPFGADIAREMGLPFVQTVHTSYVSLPAAKQAAFRAADAATTAYLCTSGNTALYSDLRLGLDVRRMLIVPNGIDTERLALADREAARRRVRAKLGLADGDFAFLNVGSIYRDKGQKLVVAALAEVRRAHPAAKVVFLGQAMEEDYLEEIRAEMRRGDVEGAVIFAEYADDVASYYAAADAFVLPSFWEGWSLALAEALYMGLRIVATDVGSARDVLPMVGAQLVPAVYETIANVDADNVGQYVRREHPQVVANLAAAMQRVCANPTPPVLSEAARRALDRREAYAMHVRLFRWFRQGGSVAAARAWTLADGRTIVVG
ncbi:MAG: glycosyltransferase [Phycisphaerae bacterium]|jgi:glycosyltransferase involved in cell wall biosynthesis